MLSGAKHLCLFPWANVAEMIRDSSAFAQNDIVAFAFVSNIEISEVSSRRERNAFIKFPWRNLCK